MTPKFTPEAIKDLKRLREFIEYKNPIAAKRISTELVAGVKKLKSFPRIGAPVDKAPNPDLLRDLFVGDYTIRYLIGSNFIYILRIWHDKEQEKDL